MMTALLGLALARSACASAATRRKSNSACQRDDPVKPNASVTVTDYAFPQCVCGEHKSSPKQFRNWGRPKRRGFSWFSPKETAPRDLYRATILRKCF